MLVSAGSVTLHIEPSIPGTSIISDRSGDFFSFDFSLQKMMGEIHRSP